MDFGVLLGDTFGCKCERARERGRGEIKEKMEREKERGGRELCLFVWLVFNVLVNYWVITRTGPKTEGLTILRAATHETELGDNVFCLSQSYYTDTDPASRERAATAEIEPEESRALPTELPPPPPPPPTSGRER